MAKLSYVRYIILGLAVASTCVDYLSRSNITLAIIAMVNSTLLESESNNNNNFTSSCPITDRNQQNYNESNVNQFAESLPGPKYNWDPKMQGVILGSFFYSFVLMQVPAGRLSEIFGGKWIVAFGIFGAALINFITPSISFSYVAMIISRIALGIFQGGIFPACYSIVYNWLPQNERSLGFAMMDVGTNIGTIISTTMSGYLSEFGFANGWPSTFYVSGLIASIHFITWSIFVTSKPRDHRLISKSEIEKIDYRSTKTNSHNDMTHSSSSNLHHDDNSDRSDNSRSNSDLHKSESNNNNNNIEIPALKVPWWQIFTSPPVLSLLFFRFSFFWTFLMIMNKLPTYMNDILHVSLTENGLLNSLLYVANSISLVTGGYMSENVIERQLLSRTATRRLFACLAGLGLATCLAFVPIVGCSPRTAISLLVLGLFFQGFSSGGDIPIPAEMTTNYPTTIYALANMCSMCPGFIAPLVVGYILSLDYDLYLLWSIIFLGSAAITALGAILFLIFASASIQSWDKIDALDKTHVTKM